MFFLKLPLSLLSDKNLNFKGKKIIPGNNFLSGKWGQSYMQICIGVRARDNLTAESRKIYHKVALSFSLRYFWRSSCFLCGYSFIELESGVRALSQATNMYIR
jgi:hypothetical protein